ncbi:MAG: hypothetical protein L6R37_001607 [Teloschistes peruensis]|nr:MAG: hypothetical protein L6R37_001607 [Teloschistes peruensis]
MPVINDPPANSSSSTANPPVVASGTTTSASLFSSSLPTPAADNLYERLSFKSKKKPPENVQFLPANAQISSVSFDSQQPAGQTPLVPEPVPSQQLNSSHTITDPVRYVTWGPKIVFYVSDSSTTPAAESSSSSKHIGSSHAHKSSSTATSKKDGGGAKFEKATLRGREQLQTTEKMEILPLERGGGVRRTWVAITRIEVVSEEISVEGKDVVAESEGESASDSDSSGGAGQLKRWRKRKAERKREKMVEEKGNYREGKEKKEKREKREKGEKKMKEHEGGKEHLVYKEEKGEGGGMKRFVLVEGEWMKVFAEGEE